VGADALERCFSKSSMMATTVSFWLLVASSFGVRPSCGAVPCSMSRGRGAATVGGGFEDVGVQTGCVEGMGREGGIYTESLARMSAFAASRSRTTVA